MTCTGAGGSASDTKTVTVTGPVTECNDSQDNDSDGLNNCADPQCHTDGNAGNAASCDPTIPSESPQCSDTVNNDTDAWTNYPADPGCTSASDPTEDPNPQCSNGDDDDSDGASDYPTDPDCTSASDPTEANPSPYPPCYGLGCSGGGGGGGGGGGPGATCLYTGIPQPSGTAAQCCSPTPGVCPASAPQCSDGQDNDGVNGADYPADPGCSSAADDNESTPAASLSLIASPGRIHAGSAATLTWSALNVQPGSCSITGTNGYTSGVLSGSLDGTLHPQSSNAIIAQTTFTLTCKNLTGSNISSSTTISIAPAYEEI